MISICKALAFLSVGIALSAAQSLPSAWTTGIATNYGGAQDGMDPSSPSFGTLDGSCGYGLLSTTVYPYWSVGALSTSNSFAIAGPSSGCGQCFEVKCMNSGGQFAGRCSSAQSVTITITDSCPECEANHLDLQALTFNKIAPMAIGRIDIQYRRVDCTPPLPVSIAIDNNVGVGGWLRLVVEKTAGFGGITAVAIRGGGGSWSPMNNKFGSAWETSNTPGLPWDFQFTSDAGQTITAMSLVSSGGVIGSIPTGVQFSLSGSTGQQAVSYDSAATSTAAATPATAATAASPPATGGATATPPSTTTPASNQAGGCPCADVQPTASITCAQQQAYGKCQDSWMTQGNFCQLTCGACPAACSASSGTPTTPATPAAAATPPATTTPTAGTTPPAAGTTPPAATTTPPTANPSAPAQAGSVQTQSIGASPPATTSTAAVSSAAATTCTDKAPASGTCAALVANNGCYKSDVLPQGTCDKSCFRC